MFPLGNQSTSANKKPTGASESSDEVYMDVLENNFNFAWGSKSSRRPFSERTHTCILCQEDTQVSMEGPPLVLAGFIQQSTVLLQNKTGIPPAVTLTSPCLLSSLGPAPHVSTCGHVMHGHCWQKYYDNVVNKENRRPYRLRQPAPFDVEKQEFLCPLCECLSNTVLPLIPSLDSLQSEEESHVNAVKNISFDEWIRGLRSVLKLKVLESSVHECNETCSELHCRARSEPTSASPPPQFPATTYHSCHVQQVAKELGESGESFASLFPVVTPQLDDKLKDFIRLFATAMLNKGFGDNGHTNDNRLTTVVSWAGSAYTLLAVETITAASNRPLLGHLSSRHRDCLQALIRINGVLGTVTTKQEVVSSHCLQLLSPFLGMRNPWEPCLLDWNAFGYLVALTMSLPSLFINESQICPIPNISSIMGLYTLKLVYITQLVKVMVTSDFSQCSADVKMEEDSENPVSDSSTIPHCTRLLETLKMIRENLDITSMNESLVWNIIKKACHSFLRSACLFYHFLSDATPPPCLTELNGDTFENMCTFLGLPDKFDNIFDSPLIYDLALEWSSRPEIIEFLKVPESSSRIRELRPRYTLVSLPNDYSELINTVSLFTCPNSDREDSRNPTMCLVCGEMLCSQSYCCQVELNKSSVGACTYHAHTCGAGVGIFLRVRECEVLLLASPNKGCVVPPPYVDQYGETDQGLRRGNPLHLCQETYNKLQMLWLGHGIHEEIARSIESTNSLMNPNWQHL